MRIKEYHKTIHSAVTFFSSHKHVKALNMLEVADKGSAFTVQWKGLEQKTRFRGSYFIYFLKLEAIDKF